LHAVWQAKINKFRKKRQKKRHRFFGLELGIGPGLPKDLELIWALKFFDGWADMLAELNPNNLLLVVREPARPLRRIGDKELGPRLGETITRRTAS
jgi:hypothetical protein